MNSERPSVMVHEKPMDSRLGGVSGLSMSAHVFNIHSVLFLLLLNDKMFNVCACASPPPVPPQTGSSRENVGA